MTFPEVVQQEGCISEEKEDLLGAKIQPGPAARAAVTVAGTSVVLFKPALVITGNEKTCSYAIRRLEGSSRIGGGLLIDAYGAATRIPARSAVTCPATFLANRRGFEDEEGGIGLISGIRG
jgi:hypothetical protein